MNDQEERFQSLAGRLAALAEAVAAGPPAFLPAASQRQANAPVRWLVIGPAGAGKTRAINALLAGNDLVPANPQAGTAAVFRLIHGSERHARLIATEAPADGGAPAPAAGPGTGARPAPIRALSEAEVAGFGVRPARPEVLAGVDHIERCVPDPLLGRGVEIIDTPGLGGFHGLEAHVCWRWLRQADRVLLVIPSGEAPVGAQEVAILSRFTTPGAPPLLVVQTKADLLAAEDRDQLRARNLAVISAALAVPVERIPYLTVSATLKERADRPEGDPARRGRLLALSGFGPLLARLEADLADRDRRQRRAEVAALTARAVQVREHAGGLLRLARQSAAEQEAARSQLAEVQAGFPTWKRRQERDFRQEWNQRFNSLLDQIDARLTRELDAKPNGAIIRPVIDDLRKRRLDLPDLEAMAPEVGDRCLAGCNLRLTAIFSDYQAESRRLTADVAGARGVAVGLGVEGLFQGLSGPAPLEFDLCREDFFAKIAQIVTTGSGWADATQRAITAVEAIGLFAFTGWGLPVIGGAVGAIVKALGFRGEERERALGQIQTELTSLVCEVKNLALRKFDRVKNDIKQAIDDALAEYFDALEEALRQRSQAVAADVQQSAAERGAEIARLERCLLDLAAITHEAAALGPDAAGPGTGSDSRGPDTGQPGSAK